MKFIWLIFIGLFLWFTYREYQKTKQKINSFEAIKPSPIAQVKTSGVDFANMILKFIEELNNANKESHRIAAVSYFLASLAAIFSFLLSY